MNKSFIFLTICTTILFTISIVRGKIEWQVMDEGVDDNTKVTYPYWLREDPQIVEKPKRNYIENLSYHNHKIQERNELLKKIESDDTLKKEYEMPWDNLWGVFSPNWQCEHLDLYGGGYWGYYHCEDLNINKQECIIYSMFSHADTPSFEYEYQGSYPDCKVRVFSSSLAFSDKLDELAAPLGINVKLASIAKLNGHADGVPIRTLEELMSEEGDEHINILHINYKHFMWEEMPIILEDICGRGKASIVDEIIMQLGLAGTPELYDGFDRVNPFFEKMESCGFAIATHRANMNAPSRFTNPDPGHHSVFYTFVRMNAFKPK